MPAAVLPGARLKVGSGGDAWADKLQHSGGSGSAAAALDRANNAQLQYTTFGDDDDNSDDGLAPGGMIVADSLVLEDDDDDAVFYSPTTPQASEGDVDGAADEAGKKDWRLTEDGVDSTADSSTPDIGARPSDGYPSADALAQAVTLICMKQYHHVSIYVT